MELEKLQKMNSNTNNSYKANIDKAIQYIAKTYGIKKPNLEDRKFLVLWLEKNLGNISIMELVKASELALNGQIELKTELYGSLSCKYFAELLYKYKKYKQEKARLDKMKAPALPEAKKTDEEKRQILTEELYRIFNIYKTEKKLPIAAYDVLFNFAWINGMTKFQEQEITNIKNKAEEIIKIDADLERSNAKDNFKMKQILDKYANYVNKSIYKNICKKLYLQKYFDDLIEMQEDIKNFIR